MKRYAVLAFVLLGAVTACRDGEDAGGVEGVTVTALSPDSAYHVQHSFSPDGKQLAYWMRSSDSLGVWALWVANADLSNARPLPVSGLAISLPVWASDSRRLAAASGRYGLADVVVVDVASGEDRRISTSPGVEVPLAWRRNDELLVYYGSSAEASVAARVFDMTNGTDAPLLPSLRRPALGTPSPDGRRIAYFTSDNSRFDLWLIDSAGAPPRQLTTDGLEILGQYSDWSPDGTRLLYFSRRTGTSDVWVARVPQGELKQLTRNVRNDDNAVWSPDGRWVAFISDRGRQTDIWLVSADGGEEYRVTNSPEVEVNLRWTEAGRLSFEVERKRVSVVATSMTDGSERQVTPDSLDIRWFTTSPDGRQIALRIARGGGVNEIAVVPTSGGPLRTLLSETATLGDARWSPDSKQLVYDSDRAGPPDIYLLDVATGTSRLLAATPGGDDQPLWTTDGKHIIFRSTHDSRLTDLWRVPAAGGEPERLTRDGTVYSVMNYGPPEDAPIVQVVGARSGALALAQWTPGGKLRTIWSKTNSIEGVAIPGTDSIVALVEQPDGSQRQMVLANDGSGGVLLPMTGALSANTARNGRWIVYQKNMAGTYDLFVYDRLDGTTRRLTQTVANERGAEFTPDDRELLYVRETTVRRIFTADISELLQRIAR